MLRAVLARLRGRLRLAADPGVRLADAAIVRRRRTAAVLVFLDWWFRFGLPVRVVLLILSLAGDHRVSRHPGGPAVAVVAARRAHPGDDARPPSARNGPADRRRAPASGSAGRVEASASPAMVRLAVQRAARPWPSSDWRVALEPQADGASRRGLGPAACSSRSCSRCSRRGAARLEPGAMAARLVAALAPADVSDRDGPGRTTGRLLAPRDERFLVEVRADLPLVEPRDGEWIVHGRGEPTVAVVEARNREVPRPCSSGSARPRERSRRSDGRVGAGAVPFEFPPSRGSSTFDLTGGDDWLGPITVERVDRPALAETQAARQGARRHLQGLPQRRRPAPAPALPARHRGRADPGRHRADLARPSVKIQAGKTPAADSRGRTDVHRVVDAPRGHDAGDPADLGEDRPGLAARVPFDRPA